MMKRYHINIKSCMGGNDQSCKWGSRVWKWVCAHPVGQLSCRRCPRRQNSWPSPACFVAACEAEQPGKMHSQQLGTHIHTRVTYEGKSAINYTSENSFRLLWHNKSLWRTQCACTSHLPLQFFAILNMLAALAYISQASSTLWFPLWAKVKGTKESGMYLFHFNIGTKRANGSVPLKHSLRVSHVVDLFILQKKIPFMLYQSDHLCQYFDQINVKLHLWTSTSCSRNQFDVFTSLSGS